MGLLGKGNKTQSKPSGTTVIAAGTEFSGELTCESALHLDGTVRGTIRAQGDVSIGESGRLEGGIQAERLVVSGHLEGDVDCHSLEIVTNGKVFGEVYSDAFVIEPGGLFRGQSHSRDEERLALPDQQAQALAAGSVEDPPAVNEPTATTDDEVDAEEGPEPAPAKAAADDATTEEEPLPEASQPEDDTPAEEVETDRPPAAARDSTAEAPGRPATEDNQVTPRPAPHQTVWDRR